MMRGFGWNGCWGYENFGNMGLVGWIVNIVLMVAVLVAIIWLVVWAVRKLTNNQKGSISGKSYDELSTAREILRTRYAKGEITREEFKQILDDIG